MTKTEALQRGIDAITYRIGLLAERIKEEPNGIGKILQEAVENESKAAGILSDMKAAIEADQSYRGPG